MVYWVFTSTEHKVLHSAPIRTINQLAAICFDSELAANFIWMNATSRSAVLLGFIALSLKLVVLFEIGCFGKIVGLNITEH